MNLKRKYLLWFAHEHIDFKLQEIASIQSIFKIPLTYIQSPQAEVPYLFVEAESEDDIKKISQRSVSLRYCLEIWAYGTNTPELHENLQKFPNNEIENYLTPAKSFKIAVETFGKHFTQKEKIAKLDAFDYLPFKGRVNLKNPDVCLHYIEYYGSDHLTPPEEPHQLFFGRWITNGLRELIKHISLKTRKFIGNTSMDAQLSLLMANQAKVKRGDLILDTFVGSGSLLVAAASFGGHVLGTDIDYLMLHARTRPSRITQKKREKDESVLANMKQYNLHAQYVDVLVQDFATNFWKDSLQFDCIITDPPYGIREAIEKIGTKKENCNINVANYYTEHYPEKVDYGLSEIYLDLLAFSAKHLQLGGRLVCWFPVFRQDYNESRLPQHPCLCLVGNSEQILSRLTARRLLTYEKVKEIDDIVDLMEYVSVTSQDDVQDFRTKFYESREETRSERRMRKAVLKEQGRIEAEKRKNTDVIKKDEF